jgi:hypothetical protein
MSTFQENGLQLLKSVEEQMAAAYAERESRIRLAAYFKAKRRNFAPGHALEDWAAAEQEVDLASTPLPRP